MSDDIQELGGTSVFVVTSGCIHEGGAVRAVASTYQRAVKFAAKMAADDDAASDAQDALRKSECPDAFESDFYSRDRWRLVGVNDATNSLCLWRKEHDFIAIREWVLL